MLWETTAGMGDKEKPEQTENWHWETAEKYLQHTMKTVHVGTSHLKLTQKAFSQVLTGDKNQEIAADTAAALREYPQYTAYLELIF